MDLDNIFRRTDELITSLEEDDRAVNAAVADQAAVVRNHVAKGSLTYNEIRAIREVMDFENEWYGGLTVRASAIAAGLDAVKAFYTPNQDAPTSRLESPTPETSGIFARLLRKKTVRKVEAAKETKPVAFEAQRAYAGRKERLGRVGSIIQNAFSVAGDRRSIFEDLIFEVQEAAVLCRKNSDAMGDTQRKVYHFEELAAVLSDQESALLLHCRTLERFDRDFGEGAAAPIDERSDSEKAAEDYMDRILADELSVKMTG